MPTALESRSALRLVTTAAVTTAGGLFAQLDGSAEAKRAGLLEAVPGVIAYYADGSSALAADFYEDARDRAGVRGSFVAEPVVLDRGEKIRRAVAWAAAPLFGDEGDPVARLAEVVQLETARPYRDTILTNRRRDPQSAGWRRIAADGCPFCRMLADRGAVYRGDTVRFASHPNCHCTAEPVFNGQPIGEEASVVQYAASKRRPNERDRARVRDYLAKNYA